MRGGGALALALAALVLLPPPPQPPASSPGRMRAARGVAAEPPPPRPASRPRPLAAGSASRGDGEELPAEVLVSEFLFAQETKTFLFHKRKREGPLSITVTPCTSSVLWSVALRPDPLSDIHATPDPEHRDANSVGDVPPPVANASSSSSSPPGGAGAGAWVAAAPGERALGVFRGRELRALRLAPGEAPAGAYAVRVRALERDSFVQLFASLRAGAAAATAGGPAAAALAKTRLRLRRRRRPGHRLTVRWEPSQLDPHLMRYCLVVNPRRRYSTLCEAREELLSAGPPPPAQGAAPPAAAAATAASGRRRKQRKEDKAQQRKDKGKGKGKPGKTAPQGDAAAGGTQQPQNDIIIGCVGKRTQYTVSGLVPGRLYHFDLFAVNRRTNLSVAFGHAELRFDARARPTALRDARPANVNLKSLDGRAAFRFKVPRPAAADAPPGDLLLYVMPCGGGAVDVRAHLQQPRPANASASAGAAAGATQEVARLRVEGFAALRVPAPPPGARLVLRAATPNAEELRRVSALQVFATTRADRFPFPTLPSPARLHEYDSLRGCDSVTVGWLPSAAPPGWAHDHDNPANASSSAGAPRLRYCMVAREMHLSDVEGGPRSDQCGLDARMRRLAKMAAAADASAPAAAVMHCFERDAALAPPPLATPPPPPARPDARSSSPSSVSLPAAPAAAPSAAGAAVSTVVLRPLRPGLPYIVQLTVQRLQAGGAPGASPTLGAPLSYDRLTVHTKPSCA